MQIRLSQTDIDMAVKQYVAKMGITRQVDEIVFSTTRVDGKQAVIAEIELSDLDKPNNIQTITPRTAPVSEVKEVEAKPVEKAPEAVVEETTVEAVEEAVEETVTTGKKSLFAGK